MAIHAAVTLVRTESVQRPLVIVKAKFTTKCASAAESGPHEAVEDTLRDVDGAHAAHARLALLLLLQQLPLPACTHFTLSITPLGGQQAPACPGEV